MTIGELPEGFGVSIRSTGDFSMAFGVLSPVRSAVSTSCEILQGVLSDGIGVSTLDRGGFPQRGDLSECFIDFLGDVSMDFVDFRGELFRDELFQGDLFRGELSEGIGTFPAVRSGLPAIGDEFST